ncbi:hypothetical protein L1987_65320 [Smallanthus sonchifolius]|uniref:Uncharacterized protein n=1 Tax=Smallanthus sonchifolius TaxID=185202 RepID=A0ACB9BU81_9ASTR|nr:hypothetical protein L1987_65320 [Smallanthus sonchifolius]
MLENNSSESELQVFSNGIVAFVMRYGSWVANQQTIDTQLKEMLENNSSESELQVFINALVQRGICVFKDEKLTRGKAISLELLKAIEESRVAVVVFSKNYANSSWCLAELAKIMEWHNQMGQKVLPVFYHVDPSDIRGQKNEVGIFFQQHGEKHKEEMNRVNEWREALTAAANLSGFHISKTFKE